MLLMNPVFKNPHTTSHEVCSSISFSAAISLPPTTLKLPHFMIFDNADLLYHFRFIPLISPRHQDTACLSPILPCIRLNVAKGTIASRGIDSANKRTVEMTIFELGSLT